MKKLFVVIGALFTLSFSAFAVDTNVTVDTTYTYEANLTYCGFSMGLGAGIDLMFTPKIGLGLDFGLSSPLYGVYFDYRKFSQSAKKAYLDHVQNGTNIWASNIDPKEFDGFIIGVGQNGFGGILDLFFNVPIRPLFKERFSLVVSPGFAWDLNLAFDELNTTSEYKHVSTSLGIGVDLRAVVRLNKFFAFNFGLRETFPFFQVKVLNGVATCQFPLGTKLTGKAGLAFYF